MKNILIPTDFSENSWNAITYALSFLEDQPCNFYIVHVSPLKVNGTASLYGIKNIVLENKGDYNVAEEQEKLLGRMREYATGKAHRFFMLHEHSFFIEAIRKQVVENEIDLIIMGTKGASGLKEAVIGSNTGDVITKVQCPVLVIPENATYKPPKEIAFPTDFNIYYKNRVLDTITEIITMKDAMLRILHISKKKQELTALQHKNQMFLDDSLSKNEHSFHFETHQSIEEGVQRFVEKNSIDMIAMVAKNLNFFQKLLFRPVVENISYHTKIPFLVLHE
ncbi:universal stress protein [Aquimarina hainanensis]|uniref:Universal stress protein n=1 Tax=Aquimarina hainanensis TaxID=1578017 RepID=A0ABW5N1K8_9FLAO|nr:universal stress protein [Aquimarina sp. TRL1]QKX04397.1 universal stress protein [Aquimarina sp. TRL1]